MEDGEDQLQGNGFVVDGEGTSFMTHKIVYDYLNYKLTRSGYQFPQFPQDVNFAGEPGRIESVIRLLAEQFELRYSQVFVGINDRLPITQANVYPTFVEVANELFRDGVRWGRIVALLVFAGTLCVQSAEKNLQHLIVNIAEWVEQYIEQSLHPWIIANGNWEGIITFYERGPEAPQSWWTSAVRYGSVAAAFTVGGISLGLMLSQKT